MEKQARVYFRRDGKQVIVAALHATRDGRLLEEDGPLSLRTWDAEVLGESVQTALDRCATVAKDRREFGFGNEGTLKASGEPSLRALTSSFLVILVSSVTEGSPGYVVRGDPGLESNLRIVTTVPGHATPAELGHQVTLIYQVCRDRHF